MSSLNLHHLSISNNIIFENDKLIAVNKPAGLLSIPDRKQSEASLKDLLIQQYGNIYTVHRLDKDTSGVILFAKNAEAHKQLSQLFEGRSITKIYMGLVQGVPSPAAGTIDVPIAEHYLKNGKMMTHTKGKPSVTDYQVLETFQLYSWMQFQLYTGRTHQIRVHTQHIGYPIVCDNLYGDGQPVYVSKLKRKYNLSKKEENEQPVLKRLALHSASLAFTFNGQQLLLEALLPKDLKAVLQQLRKLKGEH